MADYPKFGNEVIRVSKNRLLSMQRISFYHRELDLDKAIIKATECLDFSNLRSLQLSKTLLSIYRHLKNIYFLVLLNEDSKLTFTDAKFNVFKYLI